VISSKLLPLLAPFVSDVLSLAMTCWRMLVLAKFPQVSTFLSSLQTPINYPDIYQTQQKFAASISAFSLPKGVPSVQRLLCDLEPTSCFGDYIFSFEVFINNSTTCGVVPPEFKSTFGRPITLTKTIVLDEQRPVDFSTFRLTWMITNKRNGHSSVLFNGGGPSFSPCGCSDQYLPLHSDVLGWMPWSFLIESTSEIQLIDGNQMTISLYLMSAFRDNFEDLSDSDHLLVFEHLIGL
jgi:hypothetical protein